VISEGNKVISRKGLKLQYLSWIYLYPYQVEHARYNDIAAKKIRSLSRSSRESIFSDKETLWWTKAKEVVEEPIIKNYALYSASSDYEVVVTTIELK
jgi:hypothetical protein